MDTDTMLVVATGLSQAANGEIDLVLGAGTGVSGVSLRLADGLQAPVTPRQLVGRFNPFYGCSTGTYSS